MRPSRKILALLLAGLAALAGAATLRAQAIGPGYELERSGHYDEAASLYLATVRADPANLPALLGLERTLYVLNRTPELLPLVQRARAQAPDNVALRGLELRVYATLNEPDSVEAIARRWADSVPRSDVPYREWGLAFVDRRMWDEARRAYLAGRNALGGEATLAIELAELEERAGQWEASAGEWARAVTRSPDVGPNAASQLTDAPEAVRGNVLHALTAPGTTVRARRVAAELQLTWGAPAAAWATFAPTVTNDVESQNALRRFIDLADAISTPEGHRVRGLALNRWAALVPWQLASRARAEAVRELLDGGDRVTARRVLETLANDSTAPASAHTVAETALLRVLIADGQLDLAEQRLASPAVRLSGDDRAELRLMLSQARVMRGELDKATQDLGDDSSVAAIAQRGWIALYRGDLSGALKSFSDAGPYAADRAAATDRTTMMALLQHVQAPSSPELGAGLLTLARGDSAGAIAALRRAAGKLPEQGGRLDILLLAGQVAAQLGGDQEVTAVALFDQIVRAGGPGAAPAAAELDWARLLVRQGHAADAVPHLEHLILTYPNSAFVPEARHELERARGAIPKS